MNKQDKYGLNIGAAKRKDNGKIRPSHRDKPGIKGIDRFRTLFKGDKEAMTGWKGHKSSGAKM